MIGDTESTILVKEEQHILHHYLKVELVVPGVLNKDQSAIVNTAINDLRAIYNSFKDVPTND